MDYMNLSVCCPRKAVELNTPTPPAPLFKELMSLIFVFINRRVVSCSFKCDSFLWSCSRACHIVCKNNKQRSYIGRQASCSWKISCLLTPYSCGRVLKPSFSLINHQFIHACDIIYHLIIMNLKKSVLAQVQCKQLQIFSLFGLHHDPKD